MTYSLFSLVCSTLITFLVVRFSHLHSHVSADHDVLGVQKFHAVPVPRIGGVGIFTSLLCTLLLLSQLEPHDSPLFLLFLIPSSLVFVIGLLEDLTKRVSVKTRLIVTMFSALIGSLLLDATVRTFDTPLLDTLFQINLIAIVFTVVAVAGVANAVNLIDGFNGLSGFVAVTALLALGAVSFFVNDSFVLTISLAMAGAVAGFLFWNYPNAKIFLGDGGAYLTGFVIAELSVLLQVRNEEVSVLFPLLLVIYPTIETLFSIYRRKFVRGQSPGAPDAMHLHQLINKRLVRWRTTGTTPIRSRGNSMTSPYLWVLNLMAAAPAILFWNDSLILAVFILLFICSYIWLYSVIVRFRTPAWMFLPRPYSRSRSIPSIVSGELEPSSTVEAD
jgi:UDP-N-acetylmuramyl pentapeptide phosphotransferase/UDP-N-acetylglucosamine-1-phosphate transferase